MVKCKGWLVLINRMNYWYMMIYVNICLHLSIYIHWSTCIIICLITINPKHLPRHIDQLSLSCWGLHLIESPDGEDSRLYSEDGTKSWPLRFSCISWHRVNGPFRYRKKVEVRKRTICLAMFCWGYSLKFRPKQIGLFFYGIGTSNFYLFLASMATESGMVMAAIWVWASLASCCWQVVAASSSGKKMIPSGNSTQLWETPISSMHRYA